MADFPTDMTVKEYRELLTTAFKGLIAVEENCLKGKDEGYTLQKADWECIMSQYSAVTSAKGAPPIGRDSC